MVSTTVHSSYIDARLAVIVLGMDERYGRTSRTSDRKLWFGVLDLKLFSIEGTIAEMNVWRIVWCCAVLYDIRHFVSDKYWAFFVVLFVDRVKGPMQRIIITRIPVLSVEDTADRIVTRDRRAQKLPIQQDLQPKFGSNVCENS